VLTSKSATVMVIVIKHLIEVNQNHS
jgi:hypothetical protein